MNLLELQSIDSYMKKRILLTGASGTVGYETLLHLMKNTNNEITVFDLKTKRSVKMLSAFKNRIQIVHGDIGNREALEMATKEKDAVIHLAAIIPPHSDENPGLAYRVNVQGTKNLVEALEKNSPQCFFLFSSSVSVYGDRIGSPEILVTDRLIPSEGDLYGRSKVLCEEIIRQSNLSWSIFRLSAIMGNHKISKLMFHMPLETIMEICTPEDTGRAFSNAIAFENQLKSRIFNLGGGRDCVIKYRSFLERMFASYGLGELKFPKRAYAEKNFHCGIMADGHELEKIIHFRRQDLNDYFAMVDQKVDTIQKKLTFLFRKMIKCWLLWQSEPYRAFRNENKKGMEHFFNGTVLRPNSNTSIF